MKYLSSLLLCFCCAIVPSQRSIAGPAKPSAPATERPDILFIFADDFAYDCLGYAGNPVVETPNLDRLAKRSTSFTHSYNMGSWSGAVCVASRAMVNSGQFVWRAKQVNFKNAASEKLMWSQQFEKAGYSTHMTGKWHVPVDADKCFEQASTVRPGMPHPKNKEGYNRPIDQDEYERGWKPWDESQGGYWAGGKHWSEVTADEGIAFLDQHKSSDKPYFLYLAFNAPHDPRQAPRQFVEKYPPAKVDLPASFQPFYPYKDDIGCGKGLRDERLAPFPRTEFSVRVNRGEYYALITHLDQQIGRVLDALEASGRAEKTLVVFTADHGLACGHHGLMGKQNMYEHSMRVPFLISGPGIAEGKELDMPIYLQDVVPTTLESAGITVPDQVEFQSLHPLMRGEREQQYPAIYGCYLNVQRMIRKDDWKLIYYPKASIYRLYDLKNDPQELDDLAGDPGQAARIAGLKRDLHDLQAAMDDPLEE